MAYGIAYTMDVGGLIAFLGGPVACSTLHVAHVLKHALWPIVCLGLRPRGERKYIPALQFLWQRVVNLLWKYLGA